MEFLSLSSSAVSICTSPGCQSATNKANRSRPTWVSRCIEHRSRPAWPAHAAALSVGLKGRRTGTSSGRGRVASGQEGQDLADGAFPPVRFWQREVCLDVVAVAAAVLLLTT
jgi:hypothetical protein